MILTNHLSALVEPMGTNTMAMDSGSMGRPSPP